MLELDVPHRFEHFPEPFDPFIGVTPVRASLNSENVHGFLPSFLSRANILSYRKPPNYEFTSAKNPFFFAKVLRQAQDEQRHLPRTW
jgi:hypothetical protein